MRCLPRPIVNLFSLETRDLAPCLPAGKETFAGMVGLTGDRPRGASLQPVRTARIPLPQAPRSFYSFPDSNGWLRGNRETFEVEALGLMA